VSSPAAIKSETSNGPVAPASRLIPGLRSTTGGIPRKRPQSVTVGGQFWAGEDPVTPRSAHKQDAFQAIARAVLPGPFVPEQRWRLARSVFADFVLLWLSFAAISQVGVLLQFAIQRDFTALLRPRQFPVSSGGMLLLYGVLVTVLGHSDGLYRTDVIRAPWDERLILGKATAWAMLLISAAIHQLGVREISIGVLAAGALLDYLAMLGWRDWWRMVAARKIATGRSARNVLIVGAGRVGQEVANQLDRSHIDGRVVLGFLDENQPLGGDVHGRVEDLARIARTEFADEIIVATPRQPELSRRVIREARRNRLDVRIVPDLCGCEPDSVVLENFGNLPVLTVHQERMPVLSLSAKRAFDLVCSMAGLVLSAPLLAIIALAIKLDSPGPVCYCAPRVGRKGRNFACYKFRTMVVDADKSKESLRSLNQRDGTFFKIFHDSRVTRVGRFLRRYSLDELPQLGNVFTGEMSLVGPRPHPLDDFKRYDLQDLRRLDVTPGITGLWQVTARRDPSFQRNMALDLEYIECWNLWFDLRILWRTISAVLNGSGA
jgi:exopolysaccharide biosynthesis polyprenyl glycosylphosphotransferase